jgi:hypothetical protein
MLPMLKPPESLREGPRESLFQAEANKFSSILRMTVIAYPGMRVCQERDWKCRSNVEIEGLWCGLA